MAQTLKLDIDGMHCDACVRRVKTALDNQPGVTTVDVQVGHATTKVEPPATESTIRSTIDEIGFTLKQANPL